MIDQRISYLVPDAHDRVERIHRALRHQGKRTQPDASHLSFGQPEYVDSVQQDLALFDLAGRLDEPKDGQTRRRLARSGLADESEPLILRQAEADSIDRLHRAMTGVVVDAQILDLEYTGAHAVLLSRGFMILSSPAEIENSPTKMSTMIKMGGSHHHTRPRMTVV